MDGGGEIGRRDRTRAYVSELWRERHATGSKQDRDSAARREGTGDGQTAVKSVCMAESRGRDNTGDK
jgi:hypothetical protein